MITIPVWSVNAIKDESLLGLFVDRESAEVWAEDTHPKLYVIHELQFSEQEFNKLKKLIQSKNN